MTTNKIALAILALVGLFGIILACGDTNKISEAQATVRELIELKDKKQECKDGLNYQETIEEYKGLFHCNGETYRIIEGIYKQNYHSLG